MSSSQLSSSSNKRIMIIAGEASGDLHAAKLVKSTLNKRPGLSFYGIGGQAMREAGVDTIVDSSRLAVVGLVEVLAHRKEIFGILDQMRELLRTDPPDMLVLVDYPDFNLRLAETAKECGIKVFYYISPQVWAWRQGRVKKIRRLVDMMAVVFPFEEDFYQRFDVPVKFVGHPLTDEVHPSSSKENLLQEFKLDESKPVIGLFPGSRRSEIKRLLPIIIQSAVVLKQQRPDLQFILPVASTLDIEDIKSQVNAPELKIHFIDGRSYDAIEVCDAIVTVSGTVTLEIALLETPMVIINKVAWLSYHIIKSLLKIDNIGLCNIVAGMTIVPELIQNDATPEKIAATINKMLDDNEFSGNMKRDMSKIKTLLRGDREQSSLSDVVLDVLDK